jgi:hypothetical protein
LRNLDFCCCDEDVFANLSLIRKVSPDEAQNKILWQERQGAIKKAADWKRSEAQKGRPMPRLHWAAKLPKAVRRADPDRQPK